jgi:tetratricopeptide (TPR) repeat protein
MLGAALEVAHDYQGAELALNACAILKPDYPRGFEARGFAILRQALDAHDADGQARAAADFQRALELAPKDPWTFWTRGHMFRLLEQPAKAFEAFAHAMELDPEVYYHALESGPLPQTWSGRTVLEGVQRFCAGHIMKDAANPEAHAVLAYTYLGLGRFEEAFQSATRVLQMRPDHARAHAIRGAVYAKRGRLDLAQDDFTAALLHTPDNFLAAAGRARVHELQKQTEVALADFDALHKVAVTDWQQFELHAGRARTLMQLDKKDDAQDALNEARRLDPLAAEALSARIMPKAR